MLARLYVEALLVDENLADVIWELWHAGVITDDLAAWVWCIFAITDSQCGMCGCLEREKKFAE